MVVAPEIRAATPTTDGVRSGIRFDIAVPKDLCYFDGHFPACRLLPGVVQLTWALDLARQHLGVNGDFRGVSDLKFMRVIQPGDSIELRLAFDASEGRMEFEYHRDVGICARGVAVFQP